MSFKSAKMIKTLGSLIVYIFLIVVFIHMSISTYKIINSYAPDFSVFYTASRELFTKNNPYLANNLFTGVGYPIFTLILFFPLVLFPYYYSQAIFIIISILSIPVSVYLSLQIIGWKLNLKYLFLIISLALMMFPVKFTLGMGQSNNIVLLIMLYGLLMSKRGQVEKSGIIFATSSILKPITAFILLFFLLKARFRLFYYYTLTFILFILISLAIFGFNYYIYYFNNIIPPLLNLTDREIYYNQGFMGFISRIVINTSLRFQINFLVTFFSILFLFLYTKFIKNMYLGFSIYMVFLVLLDTLSWQHHFVFLIFPFIVTLRYIIHIKDIRLYILLLLSFLLVSLNIPNPQIYSSIILKSHVFIGTIILLSLLVYINNKCSKKILNGDIISK